ncbi:MAG: hypothetical protein IMZ69_06810, partial [Spirochaetes bacterium]|nr:hypothetical protein [Spirochaetota bacterium]
IPSTSLTSGGWLNLRNDFINLIGPGSLYDANVLGFSIYPTDTTQPFDSSYWLVRMNDPPIDAGKLREVTMNINAGGMFNKNDTKSGSVPFDIPELAGVKRCHYFYDPIRGATLDDKRSYVSWFDTAAGSWRCVRWNGASFTDSMVLPGITHRIDALLTTGRLFSTEGSVGRVYDSGGTEIASFPLGAFRFVGERDVDIDGIQTATALFSLARIVTDRSSESLAIDLYSIPAADLESLGK